MEFSTLLIITDQITRPKNFSTNVYFYPQNAKRKRMMMKLLPMAIHILSWKVVMLFVREMQLASHFPEESSFFERINHYW